MNNNFLEKHADLMRRWENKTLHKDKNFIEDGIIDINLWEKTDNKILFILKEAYGDYGDLCRLIRDEWKGAKYKIWWTVSYWLYALQKMEGNSIPVFPKDEAQFNECSNYLLSSAVVNIKKSNGRESSDYDDVLKYAKEDGNMLKEQITLINPDIILCGNTFDFFKEFWAEAIHPVSDTDFIYKTKHCVVIDFWHPANQFPNKLCFYALCAIVYGQNI